MWCLGSHFRQIQRSWRLLNSGQFPKLQQKFGVSWVLRIFFVGSLRDYSSISRPLERLTGKNAKFVWNDEQQRGFDKLRKALLQAPVLKIADVNRPFRVVSDASDTAIGGVLLQQDDVGEWHPVAYTSRRLRPEESN